MLSNLCVAAMGGVALARQQYDQAAQLLAGAVQSLKSIGAEFQPSDRSELEHNISQLKSSLEPSDFESSWSRGLELDFQGILVLAAR